MQALTIDHALAATLPVHAKNTDLVVSAFGLSDIGRVRTKNEDQFVIATLTGTLWVQQSSMEQARVRCGEPIGQLLVVADGIGGHAGGAEASALAVEAIEAFALGALSSLFTSASPSPDDAILLGELESAVRRADTTVRSEAASNPHLRDMGTTLTLAYSLGNKLYVAHVGDTRCCLLRAGVLQQLTHDDTVFSELSDAGVATGEFAQSRFRHVLTNAVGGGSLKGTKVEVQRFELFAGDVLLLSSDGLHDVVSAAAIAGILGREPVPERACAELVRAANESGGGDNITAVVARYDARPIGPAEA